jgi:catechol 2,3-dioxygenase-like lactoylglutathione lyase family enzyme
MDLAKDRVDFGLYTNRENQSRQFYEELGLAFLETLRIGQRAAQHRYDLGGSWLKINTSSDPALARPSGYKVLSIPDAKVAQPTTLTDPDGNAVRLVAPGFDGIDHIEIQLGVSDVAVFERFHREVLGSTRIGPGRYRLGRTIFSFAHDPAAQPYVAPPQPAGEPIDLMRATAALAGLGFRYFTIVVRDCAAEHRRLAAAGATMQTPPMAIGGATVAVCFIRDPDGNWIEVAQRK